MTDTILKNMYLLNLVYPRILHVDLAFVNIDIYNYSTCMYYA